MGGWLSSRKKGFCKLFFLLEGRGPISVSVVLLIQMEAVGLVNFPIIMHLILHF